MAKGIIVVDMPENCKKCEYRLTNGFCIPSRKDIFKFALSNEKPDWCPIRSLPERKDYKGPDAVNGTLMSTRAKQAIDEAGKMGWNACIDEILKEE